MARRVYVDSSFYIAYLHSDDTLHRLALDLLHSLRSEAGLSYTTSDGVLAEVLAFFARRGHRLRDLAVNLARDVMTAPDIEVVEQRRPLLLQALDLYAARGDKSYSLTDCSSMLICRARGITDVLTHDSDFEQEGFSILL